MNSSTTPQQSTKSCHNDKLTYSLLLCQQHRPAGLGSFDAQSLSLLPIFLRLTFPIALAGSRSLPAVWLIPYRMGFPPIKCFTLSWTHWHTPFIYSPVLNTSLSMRSLFVSFSALFGYLRTLLTPHCPGNRHRQDDIPGTAPFI